MGKMTYRKQLSDPRWQRRRLEVMARAGFKCESCGEVPEGESLHVHHRRYMKGCLAWEYSDEELCCLCNGCHLQMDRIQKEHALLFCPIDLDWEIAVHVDMFHILECGIPAGRIHMALQELMRNPENFKTHREMFLEEQKKKIQEGTAK